MFSIEEIKNTRQTIDKMSLKEIKKFYPFMSEHMYKVLPIKTQRKVKKAKIQIVKVS